MLWHYIATAARSLAHHRLHTLINMLGLSIGMAAAVLIVLFVRDELSYDRWVSDTGNLYRLEATYHIPGLPVSNSAMASFPVVTAIGQKSPQIKAVAHMVPESMMVTLGTRQFREQVTFVDSNLLGVIKLPLAEGDPARVLSEPDSVVISESIARKYFGDADPIGKTLAVSRAAGDLCSDSACLSGVYPLTVTGVLQDLPHNTQLLAALLVPNTSLADRLSPDDKEVGWRSLSGDYGYIKLRPGADPAAVLAELKVILDETWNPREMGINLKASEILQYRLTPFLSVHLSSDQYGGMAVGGSWTTVYGLAAIALLIVLIACFNFTNLATARATLRAREIALRKLGGARRGQLIAQLLLEAILTALLSLAVALCAVEILLPVYNRFLDRTIGFPYLADWPVLAALVGGAIAVGLISGAYPAFVLSAFRPAAAFRPGLRELGSPSVLRTGLVVAQFAISIALGIATLVVFEQISFARQADLGFNRDGVVILRGISRLTPSAQDSFAAELATDRQVLGTAYSNVVPLDTGGVGAVSIRAAGAPTVSSAIAVAAQPGFPAVYGARLVAGRLLSNSRGEDVSRQNMLINEAGARRLGFTPAEAVGKTVELDGSNRAAIVGVVKDMKLQGTKRAAIPVLYFFNRFNGDASQEGATMLSIRVRGEQLVDTLSFIDKTWHAFLPGVPIDRYFLSDAFESLFQPDEKQGELLGLFSGIAVFVACLGLFGLTVFTAERRTKEIGVRKIAGAQTGDILGLMLWRISVPVLIANLIAWPVAYYYLSRWLEGYAYRISLSPVYFLAGAAAALLIAWGTVFVHTLRLACASPVRALRYE